MALLLGEGAIFLHIPKTGGTWVREVLKEQGLVVASFGHLHADYRHTQYYWQQYPEHIVPLALKRRSLSPALKKDSFVFCFVRHPLSWLESWWSFMTSQNWPDWSKRQARFRRWHPTQPLERYRPVSGTFPEFLEFVIAQVPGFVSGLYARYTQPCSFVGKIEQASHDLCSALESAKIAADCQAIKNFRPLNVSRAGSVTYDWPSSLREEVIRLERRGIEAYGYNIDI